MKEKKGIVCYILKNLSGLRRRRGENITIAKFVKGARGIKGAASRGI